MRVFSIDGIVEDEAFQQQQRLNPLNADVEIKDVEDIQDLVLSSEDQMPMLVLKKPSVKRHHEPMDSSNPSFNPRSSVITTRTNNTRGRGGVRRQSLAIDFSDSEVAGSMVSMTNSSLVISAKKLPDVTIAGMQAGIGLNAQFAQFALLAAPDEVIDTVKTRTGLAKAKDSNDDKDKKVLKREYFSNIDEGDVEREAYLRKTANIQEFQEIERYLVRMNEEIDRFDLSFKFKLLEDKFRDDSCEATWSEFLKCNAEAWLCQVALLALALFSATANGSQVFGDFALFYDILWTTLFGIGEF